MSEKPKSQIPMKSAMPKSQRSRPLLSPPGGRQGGLILELEVGNSLGFGILDFRRAS